MNFEMVVSSIALIISISSAIITHRIGVKSNQLNKINALIAIRNHYFSMFRQEAEFIDRHRGHNSVVKSSAESAAELAEKMRNADISLSEYVEKIKNDK